MVVPHPGFRRKVAEHVGLLLILSSHHSIRRSKHCDRNLFPRFFRILLGDSAPKSLGFIASQESRALRNAAVDYATIASRPHRTRTMCSDNTSLIFGVTVESRHRQALRTGFVR